MGLNCLIFLQIWIQYFECIQKIEWDFPLNSFGSSLSRVVSVFDEIKTVGKLSSSAFQRSWSPHKQTQREKVMSRNSLRENPIQFQRFWFRRKRFWFPTVLVSSKTDTTRESYEPKQSQRRLADPPKNLENLLLFSITIIRKPFFLSLPTCIVLVG